MGAVTTSLEISKVSHQITLKHQKYFVRLKKRFQSFFTPVSRPRQKVLRSLSRFFCAVMAYISVGVICPPVVTSKLLAPSPLSSLVKNRTPYLDSSLYISPFLIFFCITSRYSSNSSMLLKIFIEGIALIISKTFLICGCRFIKTILPSFFFSAPCV